MPRLLHLLAPALIAYAVGVVAASAPASAEILTVGGSITVQASPSSSVGDGSIESDSSISVWLEFDGVLSANRSVQHDGTPGTYSTFNQLTSGTLFAGAYVQSYLVSFDPVGSPNPAVVIGTSGNATITFTADIIGVFAQSTGSDGLNSSDATFAPVTYSFGNGRRFNNGSDIFTISADGRTLTIDQSTRRGSQTDQLRVLVNPEPSTGLLFAIGLVGAGVCVRRRKRRRARAAQGRERGEGCGP